MSQSLGVGQIVDRHEFHVIPVQTRTNDITADAAEAIDTYFDCHEFSCVCNEGSGSKIQDNKTRVSGQSA
jgi:hypothetical protein